MPGTVAGSEPPSVSLSFANNFWGKEDAGVAPLLERMHNAKVTGDELKSFYSARAAIEEEYARKLLNLARKPLGSSEAGTLRMSLDVVRGEVESMGKAHQQIAGQMKSELEEPLTAFHGGMKERRKIVQGGIEKLHKTKNAQTNTVNKARDRFEQDCLKIKGYLAQGHMVMGQEERKNKAKLEKTQIQMSSTSNEYDTAVKILEETTGRWNREWKAACDKFQDLEEERIDFFKSSLWSFANISSTVCVSDDGSCEKIRLSLEDCEVEKDITNFIKEAGTGQEIPDPPKYIDFCRGDVEDSASTQDSDDGNYAVAQFARTMNPTFRSSSPQPSTYSSHNDPDSSLREDLGMPKPRSSMQADEPFDPRASQNSSSFNPRASQGSAVSQFDPRRSHGSAAPAPLVAHPRQPAPQPAPQPMPQQAPQQPPQQVPQRAPPQDPYADAPQIPHNPYPTDGMTQFCRPDMAPPSDRSSIPSPNRSPSRNSNSDYSDPTSFSSFEPTSGHASPTKQYNGSAMSGMSGMSSGPEDKTVQKKKSSFFQSHSPFRRRSQKNKEERPPAQPTPTTRNTWAPAASRSSQSANTSPTKPPFANRANTWQKQPSPSPDPEQVDPRADYQLNIGNSVFDVASPDNRKNLPSQQQKPGAPHEADPIAAALAELKGVAKQASVRQSADRHYGMHSPAPRSPGPDSRGNMPGAVPTPFAQNPNRSTPPPAYDQPISRLGAPQPAHTSKAMQQTTESYMSKNRNMFGNGAPPSSRPAPQTSRSADMPPRAISPAPLRPTSPNPAYRPISPNPNAYAPRQRAQSSSPVKPQQPSYAAYNASSRGNSPGYQPAPRAASPNPGYQRAPNPAATYNGSALSGASSRPASSRGSDNGGGGGGMALQLAPTDVAVPQQRQRPQSSYYGGGGGGGGDAYAGGRVRSQSQAGHRQFTKDGRPILQYARAMYLYTAAIPEELSFAKGDILAVLRLQDDGWWEAEVVGKNGRPGLVPSNYLKSC